MRRFPTLPSRLRWRGLWAGVAVTTAISVMLAWSNAVDLVFLVDIRFDPEDMRVITPVPADLCGGYE